MIVISCACALALQKAPATSPIPEKKTPAKAAKPAPKQAPPDKPKASVWVPAYTDRPAGYGPAAKVGDIVTIHFVVKKRGRGEIANSRTRGLAYTLKIGEAGNEPLLDRVVRGMKEGGTRTGTFIGNVYGPTGALPLIKADDSLIVSVTLIRRSDK